MQKLTAGQRRRHSAPFPCYVQSVLLTCFSMDRWLKASVMAAALLAGVGAFSFYYFAFVRPANNAARIDEFAVAGGRSAMVDCREAAQMIYDVHWAAACQAHAGQAPQSVADGHAECDLPEAKAAIVNAWLNEAERRCAAEARGR